MNKAVTVDQDIPKTSLIGSGSLERVMRAKMEVYNRELKKDLMKMKKDSSFYLKRFICMLV